MRTSIHSPVEATSIPDAPGPPRDAAGHESVNAGRTLSFQARLVGAQLRWLVRPWMSPRTPLRLQRLLTGLLRWTLPQGQGVLTQRLHLNDRPCDRHLPPGPVNSDAAIVYFHGGGYTVCSPDTHRSLTRLLALEARRVVHVPAYRLAPEHPYPAQLEDAQAFVATLEKQGMDVRKMVFAGDSTGAHLALTLTLLRRERGQSLPGSLVLISPCVDWTLVHLPDRSTDRLLTPGWVTWTRDGYVAPAMRSSPLVTPIHADLRHLPPVLIQSSSSELFCREARRLYSSLLGAGVAVTWQEWHGLWHDFQMHAALVPEGREAVRRIARFVQAAVPVR
ncbi:MAG: alpha/beta hydrolase fold domain-containing protein [Hydrogenophaga sp.]|uniref:alpha/beta hydrolase n=1 Tax=Hydrogenophaga sp. TaxID=1904254 RepID=UPI00262671E9|nr:alpha/beta hydrolase fold domain-containing protein [Hydrogenophaga sp.]MDM7941386.1 alpha/beta hydrolase fold domain-containing protein [Hydrogenophaga sp.]